MKKELMFVFCLVFLTGFVVAIEGSNFCGSSTNALCSDKSDCKAGGCSGQVCGSINDSAMTTCEYTECYNAASYGLTCGCSENKCRWVTAIIPKCDNDMDCMELVCPNGGFVHERCVNGTCITPSIDSCPKIPTCNDDMDCMELVCPNGGFVHERCINGTCITPSIDSCPKVSTCAKEGEQFSKVYSEYPKNCCAGLTEWDSGTDMRMVKDGACVPFVDTLEGNNFVYKEIGTCINCGNGICEKIENICNCQKDCANTTTTTIIEESNTTIYKCPNYVLPFCEHELTGIKDKNGCQMFICKKRLATTIQNQSECPENCTCSGSTVKCMINGQREMTITAGKSGNVIVQIKGENMSTNVTLYKSNEKIYGVFKDNETKEVKMMPDQVAEKIKERLQQREEKYNITLDENGIYQVQTKKKAKLFYLFPVREKTQLELSSESGEIIKVRNPWWGFLAKDIKEQSLVGSSCGTVTPGYNDACCQTKGYDVWNATSSNCEFN